MCAATDKIISEQLYTAYQI